MRVVTVGRSDRSAIVGATLALQALQSVCVCAVLPVDPPSFSSNSRTMQFLSAFLEKGHGQRPFRCCARSIKFRILEYFE